MKRRGIIAWAVVCTLVLVTAACGGGGAGTAAAPTTSSTKPVSEMMDRDVEIEITGARRVRFHKRVKLHLLRVRTDEPKQNLTSITIPEPIDIGGGVLLMPDVALYGPLALQQSTAIPAGYGPAPAGVPKVETPPLGPGEAAPGHARLTFVTRQPPAEVMFGYVAEPCPVSLQADGVIGSVTCSAIYAPTGEKLTFTMRWDA